MNFSKNQLAKHFGFWVSAWFIQSLLFSGGKDLQFFLVKNIAIISLQMTVVYLNFYLTSILFPRKKYGFYTLFSILLVYLVYAISHDSIDLVTSLFFPSLFNASPVDHLWWPTGFWSILSGSTPYSIALLSSTIIYLISTAKDKSKQNEPPPEESSVEKGVILINEGKTLHRINTADVLYVEGLKEYVNWHIAGKKLITLHSLQKLENLLEGKGFIRTHKSFIVNTNCIDTIKSNSVEISGKKIPIGRSYREKVQQHFSTEQTAFVS